MKEKCEIFSNVKRAYYYSNVKTNKQNHGKNEAKKIKSYEKCHSLKIQIRSRAL